MGHIVWVTLWGSYHKGHNRWVKTDGSHTLVGHFVKYVSNMSFVPHGIILSKGPSVLNELLLCVAYSSWLCHLQKRIQKRIFLSFVGLLAQRWIAREMESSKFCGVGGSIPNWFLQASGFDKVY